MMKNHFCMYLCSNLKHCAYVTYHGLQENNFQVNQLYNVTWSNVYDLEEGTHHEGGPGQGLEEGPALKGDHGDEGLVLEEGFTLAWRAN